MKPLHPNQLLGFSTLEDLPYDPNAPIKKGAKIKKIKGQPEDIHKIGATGITVGAFQNKGEWCYYVKFGNDVATNGLITVEAIIGIMGFKIEEITDNNSTL
jgi:hypothetical protein